MSAFNASFPEKVSNWSELRMAEFIPLLPIKDHSVWDSRDQHLLQVV